MSFLSFRLLNLEGKQHDVTFIAGFYVRVIKTPKELSILPSFCFLLIRAAKSLYFFKFSIREVPSFSTWSFQWPLFIPHAHFETSLKMISYYGYEVWYHK